MGVHVAPSPHNLVLFVEQEEGMQQILLGPEPVVVHHPSPRIFHWEEDVVEVDQDAFLEPGQHLE